MLSVMGVGTWLALALLAQVSAASSTPDAGTSASPAGCAVFHHYELKPLPRGPLETADGAVDAYREVLREELIGDGAQAPVLMVTTTSIEGRPETAVFIATTAGSAKAKVTVRRYRENLWVGLSHWMDRRPEWRLEQSNPQGQRAALAAVPRKVDTFKADLDARTFEAIARVWSLMLDRAREHSGPPKVKVFSHVTHYFQHEGRAGRTRGISPDSALEQLVSLGTSLISYASAKRPSRQGQEELVAAAASLEARLKWLKLCPAND